MIFQTFTMYVDSDGCEYYPSECDQRYLKGIKNVYVRTVSGRPVVRISGWYWNQRNYRPYGKALFDKAKIARELTRQLKKWQKIHGKEFGRKLWEAMHIPKEFRGRYKDPKLNLDNLEVPF